jgi:tripartite-type tricarboxylate transporter receptor subunit TctC
MKTGTNWYVGSIAALAALLCVGIAASIASAAELYEGKRVALIIGFKPGGTADADGRLIAKHLPNHIPGKPNFVVRNMPGAGGIKATNLAYNVAKPDGLSIYQLASGHYLQQLAGSKVVQFDISKMPILGAWTRSQYALVVRADKFKSIEDMRKSKIPVRMATSGIGTGTYLYTIAWQKALGINFHLITGYDSAEQDLALERGEVDARTNSAKSVVKNHPHWIQKNFAPILVVGGPNRDPLIPNVPTVQEINPNPGPFFEAVSEGLSVARPYALSPGTPAENLKALRAAWQKMLDDKEFQAEVNKRKWDFVPTSYDKLESFYRKVIKETPADVVNELKAIFP